MTQEDTPMPNAPPTPGEDADADADADTNAEPTSPVIDYSPATLPYDEAFENALMAAILYPPESLSPRTPLSEPPIISRTALPIPLSSPLRTYASPIPGVLLTHPNGYHTGGPGPSSNTIAEFAKRFIEEHGIEDAGQLERMVEKKIAEKMEVVRERLRDREEAVNRNRAVERELEDLNVQRAAELSVVEKLKGGRNQ